MSHDIHSWNTMMCTGLTTLEPELEDALRSLGARRLADKSA